MNQKTVLSALGIVAVSASMAFAALTPPGDGVVGSIHDMNNYTGATPDTQGRVCAFCHTPHHALTEGSDYLPLWSHELPNTSGYVPYDSATIDTTIDPTTMMEGPSTLCMRCHDGAIAVDTHYATVGTKKLSSDGWDGAAIAQTATLNNDHPIGFVFDEVANGPITGDPPEGTASSATGKDNWVRTSDAPYLGNTQLKIVDRLYGGTQGKIMTCATCHDVHNKKNVDDPNVDNYLLLSPNTNSSLCLTCHIK